MLGKSGNTMVASKIITYDNDMEAALLQMCNFIQSRIKPSQTEISGWSTGNMFQTTGEQPLLSRLKSVRVLLMETYNYFESNSPQLEDNNYKVVSDSIIDNYHRIKKQVKVIHKYLDKISKLPYYKHLPRIYVIAREIVSRTDGNFNLEFLINCLKRFQTKISLNLEELWGIPAMLKLVIIEHIALTSTVTVMNYILSNLGIIRPTTLGEFCKIIKSVDLSQVDNEFFVTITDEIERNSRNYDLDFVFPWVDHNTNRAICNSDLNISSFIKTLSLLSTLQWDQIGFVENLSVIDKTLEKFDGDNFQRLDRSTKNHYRLVVHQIDENSVLSEEEIAKLVVDLAENYGNVGSNCRTSADSHKSDIGYYLIDEGLPLLQKLTKMELSVTQKMRQYCCATVSIFHYVGSILFLACIFTFLGFNYFNFQFSNYGLHLLAFMCTFLISTQWANEILNYLATKLVKPNLLPRFDFSKTGIPSEFRTIVVIPCLISNYESINSLISKLETRFIGNQDENLDFALLTDFEDANQEILLSDQLLLDYLKSKILHLNGNYCKTRNNGRSIFYAFHRPRVFNPADNIWMGYERKRGKLAAFNNLLKGIEIEKFNFIVGDISKLQSIKYVITLDADTSLSIGSARKLVGTMAHPLNRPVFSDSCQSISRGFGILQPRISLNLPAANASIFSKIFSSSYVGLDPYSRAISNVYQDLFGESSYIGKGIYDVDVFQKILTGKFPENRILSHDLLEGNYLRTGFVGDVQLYEDFPQTYICDLVRRHRWIRGDWQNVNYVADKNFSVLSKWKILDNLRRSLIPIAELLLFLIYWRTWPILFFLGKRIVFSFDIHNLISFSKFCFKLNVKSKCFLELPSKNELVESLIKFWHQTQLFLFEISCLPNEAYHSFDAIMRTIIRLFVTKKHLLEWTASGSVNINSSLYLRNILWRMSSGIFLFFLIIALVQTESTLLPILFSWSLSPLFAWRLSQSVKIMTKKSVLSTDDISFLRRIARKTWSYFEQFNTAEENYLPPDNYREFPNEFIAHHTSPTNIGLAVLSNLTAFDFGYLSCTEMVQRISNTFKTLEKLQKYRGHFYNWYNTQSTKQLVPRYVSTVDSGNLAGSLLVLRQGLLTIPNANIVSKELFEGLLDTFRLSVKELEHFSSSDALKLQTFLEDAIKKPKSLPETYQFLNNIQIICSNISDSIVASDQNFVWFKKFDKQVVATLGDLSKFAPWLKLEKTPEEFKCFWDNLNSSVTLRSLAEYPLHTQFENYSAAVQSSWKVENKVWLENLKNSLDFARKNAIHMINSLEELARTCENLVDQMEFDFLYEDQRRLLRIGYSVENKIPDDCCYDLLASEARLGVFVAVAKGKIPLESWFQLGRKLTKKAKVLESWTGSMFEYLMPQLVMPSYENTQLKKTFKEIVKIQIDYGLANGIPWGISESATAEWVQSIHDYFYRASGIKELSLDPKLENCFVIAPYASMLALMVRPKEACLNLKKMSLQEIEGVYGFYEAADFTSTSLDTAGEKFKKIVRTYMAHHQGMSLLALENVLLNEPMQRRFEEDPSLQSCLILLK